MGNAAPNSVFDDDDVDGGRSSSSSSSSSSSIALNSAGAQLPATLVDAVESSAAMANLGAASAEVFTHMLYAPHLLPSSTAFPRSSKSFP